VHIYPSAGGGGYEHGGFDAFHEGHRGRAPLGVAARTFGALVDEEAFGTCRTMEGGVGYLEVCRLRRHLV